MKKLILIIVSLLFFSYEAKADDRKAIESLYKNPYNFEVYLRLGISRSCGSVKSFKYSYDNCITVDIPHATKESLKYGLKIDPEFWGTVNFLNNYESSLNYLNSLPKKRCSNIKNYMKKGRCERKARKDIKERKFKAWKSFQKKHKK